MIKKTPGTSITKRPHENAQNSESKSFFFEEMFKIILLLFNYPGWASFLDLIVVFIHLAVELQPALASTEVTDSNKHRSLLLHKINYSHEKFNSMDKARSN